MGRVGRLRRGQRTGAVSEGAKFQDNSAHTARALQSFPRPSALANAAKPRVDTSTHSDQGGIGGLQILQGHRIHGLKQHKNPPEQQGYDLNVQRRACEPTP
jgi:hypothetical protein